MNVKVPNLRQSKTILKRISAETKIERLEDFLSIKGDSPLNCGSQMESFLDKGFGAFVVSAFLSLCPFSILPTIKNAETSHEILSKGGGGGPVVCARAVYSEA